MKTYEVRYRIESDSINKMFRHIEENSSTEAINVVLSRDSDAFDIHVQEVPQAKTEGMSIEMTYVQAEYLRALRELLEKTVQGESWELRRMPFCPIHGNHSAGLFVRPKPNSYVFAQYVCGHCVKDLEKVQ